MSINADTAHLRPVEEQLGDPPRSDGSEPRPSSDPVAALTTSRVDLVEVIRSGIPEREYVPGGKPWLIAGKRYLMPAPAGAGKSLAALVIGVDAVEAGGTVAILDVENGADEYARRLADVLEARDGPDGRITGACSERLRYYEWPALRASWAAEEWAVALDGVDLVIFDSSRLVLSAAGLSEDSNDEYATFVNGLLIPLARAGTTTMVLDNTGHEERGRARGASAKGDLNEVVYVVKVGEPFDRERRGHLRLTRDRTRFSGLPEELHVPIGDGAYGPPEIAEAESDSDGFRPTALMERASRAIEATPGMSRNEVLAATGGKRDYATLAVTLLIADGFVRDEPDGQAKRHYSIRPYRESEEGGEDA